MTDTPKRACSEAESWLNSAKHSLEKAKQIEADASVCCAEAIHAVIRANDALALEFLGHKPTRHDDAAIVFAKLVREGKLPDKTEHFRNLVAKSMRDKSGADYGKSSFSYEDAQEYVEQTELFVAMTKDVLKL
ncbi:MAG: hypothetical protein WC408_03485 [Candidatus Micrarchaeia archaeon]|jgi:uncharacterized protein (UPF0332 family)